MKNKFQSLLIFGIGLAFATASAQAKTAHQSAKKHHAVAAKHEKTKHHKSTAHTTHTKNKRVVIASTKRKLKTKKHHYIAKHDARVIAKSSNVQQNLIAQPPAIAIETNNRIHSLISTPHENSFVSVPVDKERHSNLSNTHGIIQSSLFAAGRNAGLSEDLVNQLTGIFAWDIDFATSLRSGDQFTVVYGTNNSGRDEILAAEFVNSGKISTAIRYKDAEGNINYYSPEGKTMRKSFLSTPVAYDHISSHFDTHRRHPVLNRIRAHKGVDYAARTGTPVKAAGDGNIVFLDRKGGYGQVLILKHGEHFETVYAHLSKFKHNLQEGDTVRQGQVIGYVGQTGLATGPHLHYEFRVDGVHRNPEAVTQDNSSTINRQLLADFKSKAQPLLTQLYQTKSRTLYAKIINKIN